MSSSTLAPKAFFHSLWLASPYVPGEQSLQGGTWQVGLPTGTHSKIGNKGEAGTSLNSTLALSPESTVPVWEHHGMRTGAREQKMASAAGPDRRAQRPTYPTPRCCLPTSDFKQHLGVHEERHAQAHLPFPEGDWVSKL